MKAGKTINELAITVAELRNQARDYRVTQSALTMGSDLNLSAQSGNIRIKPTELIHSQIADKLCLSVKTIETYREHLKQKLNLANGQELLRYAIEWSLNSTSK